MDKKLRSIDIIKGIGIIMIIITTATVIIIIIDN